MLRFSSVLIAVLYVSRIVSASFGTDDEDSIQKYKTQYLQYASEKDFGVSHTCAGDVETDKIKFTFYNSPNTKIEWTLNDELPTYPAFNPDREMKVFIHGWLQEDILKKYTSLPLMYSLRGKRVNVISVDWSQYSGCDYDTTTRNVLPKVAEIVSQMIRKMTEKGVQEKRVHLVGFDMGAHVAGFVGKSFTNNRLGRITGLSPAGMKFNSLAETERLSKSDADFVDVIHTNMGTYGISALIGNADILPNGGRKQPDSGSALGDMNSHVLALKYFVESVDKSFSFLAQKCTSWQEFKMKKCFFRSSEIMGENISKTRDGTFYLFVNNQLPYGKGVSSMFFLN